MARLSRTQQQTRKHIELVRGRSSRQIAEALFISQNTVQTHLRHMYEKLDVRSRTQILARLFQETYTTAFGTDREPSAAGFGLSQRQEGAHDT